MKIKGLLLGFSSVLALLLTGCAPVDRIDDGGDIIPVTNEYYLASFVNFDNSFLYQSYFKNTEVVTYKGPTPTRNDDGTYTYTFSGWDKELTTINQNTVYTAQYNSRLLESYNISFVNYDGTVLYETVVKEGEDIFYVGETPSRPDDADGTTYTFIGWNKELKNIKDDTIFTAVYSSKKLKYTVRFLNYDDSILDIQYINAGEGVNYMGPTPTRPDDGATVYTFSGWDSDVSKITGDIDIHATFTESTRDVVVTFVDYDGKLLETQTVEYGGEVIYSGTTPYRAPEGRYQYSFSKWSIDTSAVYSDLVVTAVYDRSDRTGTSGLTYTFNSNYNGYIVTSYNDYGDSEVFIPKKYNNKPVVGITGSVFAWKSGIKSIFIEDNVTFIDGDVFCGCYDLESIRLSDELNKIQGNCFGDLSKLKTLEIPSSVSYIDPNVFSGLYSDKCEITISKNNQYYEMNDGMYLTNKSKTTIYSILRKSDGFDKLEIPEGYEEIGDNAFSYYSCRVDEIVIPSTMKRIGQNAFGSAYGTKKITFDNCPCLICDNAFSNCYEITEIDFGDSLVGILNYAFNNINNIEEITLPKTVTTLTNPFGNSSIKSIVFEEENDYFASVCGMLIDKKQNYVSFYPKNYNDVLTLDGSFSCYLDTYRICTARYTGFEVDENNSTYCSIGNFLLSKDQTNIRLLAYTDETTINMNSLPSSVQTISEYAFAENDKITSVDFSSTSINNINYNAFYHCANLSTISLPSSVSYIGSSCFDSCALTSFTVPEGVHSIDSSVFARCSSLETVTLHEGITSISYWSFAETPKLKSIDLPSNLTYLSDYAFYNSGIEEIDIPETITSLSNNTFSNCRNLKTVTLPNTLTSIGDNCFSSCTSLTSITIPDSVTNIQSYAFSNCSSLTEITFGTGMTTLGTYGYGEYMLSNCSSLTKINFANNLQYLEPRMFSNASKLSYLVLPASFVNFVNSEYFEQCYLLNKIFLLGGYPTEGYSLKSTVTYYEYSETYKEGKYWHYDANNVPTIWTK